MLVSFAKVLGRHRVLKEREGNIVRIKQGFYPPFSDGLWEASIAKNGLWSLGFWQKEDVTALRSEKGEINFYDMIFSKAKDFHPKGRRRWP